MLIVTTNDLPGFNIVNVLGEIFGITVRSLNFGSGFTAGFRSLGGGEVPEMTSLVTQSRNEAMNRLIHEGRRTASAAARPGCPRPRPAENRPAGRRSAAAAGRSHGRSPARPPRYGSAGSRTRRLATTRTRPAPPPTARR